MPVNADAVLRLVIALAITQGITAEELAIAYADEKKIQEFYRVLLALTNKSVA